MPIPNIIRIYRSLKYTLAEFLNWNWNSNRILLSFRIHGSFIVIKNSLIFRNKIIETRVICTFCVEFKFKCSSILILI